MSVILRNYKNRTFWIVIYFKMHNLLCHGVQVIARFEDLK